MCSAAVGDRTSSGQQLARRLSDPSGMTISVDGVRVHWPEENAARRPAPDPGPVEPTRAAEELSPSTFQRVLDGLGASIDEGERIVVGAAGGYSSLDPAELIALQAGIYRYGEAIELTAKLVDRATSAVRTVLQGGH